MAVPPVGATVAVDMASSCAPGCRALEDVLMHGQDWRDEDKESRNSKHLHGKRNQAENLHARSGHEINKFSRLNDDLCNWLLHTSL